MVCAASAFLGKSRIPFFLEEDSKSNIDAVVVLILAVQLKHWGSGLLIREPHLVRSTKCRKG